MRNLDDAALEHRLRAVLNEHLGALPLELSVETLGRRREAKGVARASRRAITLLAAAALLIVCGALAAGSGILRLPTIVPPVPSDSAAPSASAIPVAGPGGVWIATGSMVTPRSEQDAVRLLDGRVLVVGGSGGEFDPSTAELYDPVSGTWSATGSMLNPREGLSPVVLLDGRVLVGDVSEEGSNGQPDVYGSELYDPATGTWSATGDAIWSGRGSAVVLPDGKVYFNETVYDPASGTWAATEKRNNTDNGSGNGAAILLSDGKVLVAGGYRPARPGEDPSFAFTDAADVYDPATDSWTEIANMHEPSRADMATLLPDGRALVVGRNGSWETYDPATGTWTALAQPAWSGFPTALLSDGTVLLTDAGQPPCPPMALYDPRTASLTIVSSMLGCADGSSFTLLLDGTILVAGGRDCNGDGVCVSNGSAAVYVPAGVPLPSLPAFPDPLPPVFASATPLPTPLPPAAGPVPPNARSWTVTVDNRSSEPAALFVADDTLRLVGSATPNVVPAGATMEVTFLFPADGGWIYVNPRPGGGGSLVNADDIGIPGKILIGVDGREGWLSP